MTARNWLALGLMVITAAMVTVVLWGLLALWLLPPAVVR